MNEAEYLMKNYRDNFQGSLPPPQPPPSQRQTCRLLRHDYVEGLVCRKSRQLTGSQICYCFNIFEIYSQDLGKLSDQ